MDGGFKGLEKVSFRIQGSLKISGGCLAAVSWLLLYDSCHFPIHDSVPIAFVPCAFCLMGETSHAERLLVKMPCRCHRYLPELGSAELQRWSTIGHVESRHLPRTCCWGSSRQISDG